MVKIQKIILIGSLISSSALQSGEKDLEEIADLPHAQKFIRGVLKQRGLNPKDFRFRLPHSFPFTDEDDINMACGLDYDYSTKKINHVLHIQKKDLVRVNTIMAHQDGKFQKKLSGKDSQFKKAMQYVLGHELQHYFDNVSVIALCGGSYSQVEDYKNRSFDEKRQSEIKADKCASIDPEILRAGAKYWHEVYDRSKFFIDFIYRDPNQQIDEHPHPLERAHYLLVAANAQEVINKKFNSAYSCLTKKHKEAVINRNLADIEKIVG